MPTDKRFSGCLAAVTGLLAGALMAQQDLPQQPPPIAKEKGYRFTYKLESERLYTYQCCGILNQPIWSGGALIGIHKNMADEPILFRIDRNDVVEDIRFIVTGAAHFVHIYGIAGDSDGSVVGVASALTDDGEQTSVLVRFGQDRLAPTVTRLWPYLPYAVTIGPDHSIYVIGSLKNLDQHDSYESHVLRRFDPSGKLVMSQKLQVKGDYAQLSNLVAMKDRLCWLTRAGQYVELSFEGRVLDTIRPPTGVELGSMAVSPLGDVLVGATLSRTWAGAWWFNRPNRSWDPILLEGETYPMLNGFDGDRLIVVQTHGLVHRFVLDSPR